MSGSPIAYCEDGRHLYAFNGVPLGYLDGDSVFAFDGQHLGWWDHGWVRDHHGAWALFTELAMGTGLSLPVRKPAPAKGFKNAPPPTASRGVKPVPPAGGSGWSSRSGAQFFPSRTR
ncbi:MAG TPA: hypothetical protein VFT22_40695 [Kofleriaceae bacterium]|nr:hypothetical protein [Kofleriaceae bacterium]